MVFLKYSIKIPFFITKNPAANRRAKEGLNEGIYSNRVFEGENLY